MNRKIRYKALQNYDKYKMRKLVWSLFTYLNSAIIIVDIGM